MSEKQCDLQLGEQFNTVKVAGEVDLSWSGEMRDTILRAMKCGKTVKVDLSAVDYIDSSGIAALVEGLQTAKQKNLSFYLSQTSQAVRSVLALARLDKVFEMEEA